MPKTDNRDPATGKPITHFMNRQQLAEHRLAASKKPGAPRGKKAHSDETESTEEKAESTGKEDDA